MNTLSTLDGEAIARQAMQTPAQKMVTQLKHNWEHLPQVDMPLQHRFTPGLYTREIFMPKGTLVISKIHKTEHQYIISKGVVSVWIEGVGTKKLQAPYHGITKPGTRRILFIHEDCIWTTFHATNKTDVNEIEQDVIYNPETDDVPQVEAEVIQQLKDS